MFLNPNSFFSTINSNCIDLLDMRNLQEEQGKKAFCYQKLFWPFTVRTNWSSDLKFFTNSWPLALNFKRFFSITETIFSHIRSEQFWYQNNNLKIKNTNLPTSSSLTILMTLSFCLIKFLWRYSDASWSSVKSGLCSIP